MLPSGPAVSAEHGQKYTGTQRHLLYSEARRFDFNLKKIDRHNDNPKPFVWTATTSDILEKVKCERKALNNG